MTFDIEGWFLEFSWSFNTSKSSKFPASFPSSLTARDVCSSVEGFASGSRTDLHDPCAETWRALGIAFGMRNRHGKVKEELKGLAFFNKNFHIDLEGFGI